MDSIDDTTLALPPCFATISLTKTQNKKLECDTLNPQFLFPAKKYAATVLSHGSCMLCLNTEISLEFPQHQPANAQKRMPWVPLTYFLRPLLYLAIASGLWAILTSWCSIRHHKLRLALWYPGSVFNTELDGSSFVLPEQEGGTGPKSSSVQCIRIAV